MDEALSSLKKNEGKELGAHPSPKHTRGRRQIFGTQQTSAGSLVRRDQLGLWNLPGPPTWMQKEEEEIHDYNKNRGGS